MSPWMLPNLEWAQLKGARSPALWNVCVCVCPIAPPVAFGEDAVLVEAARTQDVARRFPLAPGDQVNVGVRRIHALVHPGLSFLILTDGSEASQDALDLGGQIARLAHARVTILSYGLEADKYENHL